MLFIACNSGFFFSAAKSSRELQIARSFPSPKATVFYCFHLEENGDLICYEESGTISSSVSAFCFMLSFTSVALKNRQITSVWYRQQFFSIRSLLPSFAFFSKLFLRTRIFVFSSVKLRTVAFIFSRFNTSL